MIGLSANPGQTIIIAVQTLDGYGSRVDGYIPQIDFVMAPSGSEFSGFPSQMTRITEGLYNSAISLPTGLSAVGTYLVSVSWLHPDTNAPQYELFLINAGLPFGAAIVTPA